MEELEHHLWSELHDLFDTDDGDLPDIDVNYRHVNEAACP